MNYKERLVIDMDLKVGEVVEFKKYDDMTGSEAMGINEESFPKYGKITEIGNDGFFFIEGYGYLLNPKSVARVISDIDDVDINSLNPGDEVLVKVTVKKVFDGFIQINSSVGRTDVVNVLKRKEEHFIVREDHYGMYVNGSEVLVVNEDDAKIYNSRDEANDEAADMHLNAWDVIKYGD